MILEDDSEENGGIRHMSETANLLGEPLESYGTEQEQPKSAPTKIEPGKRLKPIDRSQCFWCNRHREVDSGRPSGTWDMGNGEPIGTDTAGSQDQGRRGPGGAEPFKSAT